MKLETAKNLIRKFFRQQKRLPSYQEMCRLFGFASKQSSFRLAKKLVEEGTLKKDDKGRLVPGRLFSALPIAGIIAAGMPRDASETLLDSLSFDDYLVKKPGNSYLLRVSGDSMIEAGINEGDLVVVEKDKLPGEGDVVVAFIDDEFTLKHFSRKNSRIALFPANKKYPVLYPRNQLSIFGTVVAVIRKYH
ncbi:repressor LexA [Candidatus Gottesmanbacteria bacterium RIFCSPHIGHO2_02_FULL_40_24]|uniref:Repressor LexA n=1 Tax=Candidatus Gottesmanbacteria bacterium RIFCSPHIGHO2_01_FULL_40_15 TaxID=1798376 RepID=A0A1F5Z704_9BACT|nr:MAG: repressor LexA [Candidatus Gottesmanbacteria bacterium RIFCSPHIGHO2_01_FULL_40_15]OGG16477.1 MAG: repressor LexA [Candidatus Gottesmanbacteria bacterium RIFCSPHIGHO2_02_FULL_40_24]OGG22757.1 MAG: repressor LexA [Candidatus Gottesmanbacteria bacterium RIFCSPLOWO2_01_FULL_40_10]OGG25590.1 MAG: repressor LexA [Candidatus Gottesmanbacteria bacterium RIFCSPHIGHO2_12_FULL_40_13]OGG32595.1 MAG: repressor LexA [Candidatus Gottesmanbacteria bacterium RIFCSPLOWO2_02_FULL_40_10]